MSLPATVPRPARGRSGPAGERAVRQEPPGASVIARTAWLHGVHGANFVRTMIGLEARRPAVDVVDGERGQPTWSADAAERTAGPRPGDGAHGVPHAVGETTWYEPARGVFRLMGADPERIRPATGLPAPPYSALAHDRGQDIGLPAPRDRRSPARSTAPHRKESPLRETP